MSAIEPGEYNQTAIEPNAQSGKVTRYQTLMGPSTKSSSAYNEQDLYYEEDDEEE